MSRTNEEKNNLSFLDDARRTELRITQLLLTKLQPRLAAGNQLRVRPGPSALIRLRRRCPWTRSSASALVRPVARSSVTELKLLVPGFEPTLADNVFASRQREADRLYFVRDDVITHFATAIVALLARYFEQR